MIYNYKSRKEIKEYYHRVKNYNSLPFNLIVYDENTKDELHIFPKHWHEHLEITVTISGKGVAFIENEEYQINNQSVLIVNPNSLHCIQGKKPYNKNIGFCLQIDIQNFYNIFPSLKKQFHSTCNDEITHLIINEIVLLNQKIIEQKDDFEIYRILINILKILDKQESLTQVKKENEKNKYRILEISKYIQEHYNETLNVIDLAEHFRLSESHFINYLKTILINQFINILQK